MVLQEKLQMMSEFPREKKQGCIGILSTLQTMQTKKSIYVYPVSEADTSKPQEIKSSAWLDSANARSYCETLRQHREKYRVSFQRFKIQANRS